MRKPDQKTKPGARPGKERGIVLFDLDGTLADTAPDLAGTMNVILRHHGRCELPEDRVRHLVGGGARLLMERGFRETGAPASEAMLDQLLKEFLCYYSDHIADKSRLWPGVQGQLNRLEKSGTRMAVCTNKTEKLARKALKALGLNRYFPVIIGGDTLPVKKPDPAPLLEAVRQLYATPAQAVMIGDSAPDMEAARLACIPSVCVRFGYSHTPVHELGADTIMDHFDQLPEALNFCRPGLFPLSPS